MNPKKGLNRCDVPEEELGENELTGERLQAIQQQRRRDKSRSGGGWKRPRAALAAGGGAHAGGGEQSAAVTAAGMAAAERLHSGAAAGGSAVAAPMAVGADGRPRRERKAPRRPLDDEEDAPQHGVGHGGRGGGHTPRGGGGWWPSNALSRLSVQ